MKNRIAIVGHGSAGLLAMAHSTLTPLATDVFLPSKPTATVYKVKPNPVLDIPLNPIPVKHKSKYHN